MIEFQCLNFVIDDTLIWKFSSHASFLRIVLICTQFHLYPQEGRPSYGHFDSSARPTVSHIHQAPRGQRFDIVDNIPICIGHICSFTGNNNRSVDCIVKLIIFIAMIQRGNEWVIWVGMFGETHCMHTACKNKIEIVWNYGKMLFIA